MRVAVLALLAVAGSAHASDLQLWTEAGVRHELGRRVALTFDQHLRFDDDVSRVNAVMPELGVQLRATGWLRLAAGYRFEYERDGDGDLVLRHRFHLAARSRLDVGSLRLEHRLQLQESLRPSSKDVYRHVVRNRAEVVLRRFRPWTAALSAELFHAVDDGDAIHLDKVWLTAGGAFGPGASELELFYRIELPVAGAEDPTLHIIGVAFHRDL